MNAYYEAFSPSVPGIGVASFVNLAWSRRFRPIFRSHIVKAFCGLPVYKEMASKLPKKQLSCWSRPLHLDPSSVVPAVIHTGGDGSPFIGQVHRLHQGHINLITNIHSLIPQIVEYLRSQTSHRRTILCRLLIPLSLPLRPALKSARPTSSYS